MIYQSNWLEKVKRQQLIWSLTQSVFHYYWKKCVHMPHIYHHLLLCLVHIELSCVRKASLAVKILSPFSLPCVTYCMTTDSEATQAKICP